MEYSDFKESWFVFGCSRFMLQTTIVIENINILNPVEYQKLQIMNLDIAMYHQWLMTT